jgi:hypothetical protein
MVLRLPLSQPILVPARVQKFEDHATPGFEARFSAFIFNCYFLLFDNQATCSSRTVRICVIRVVKMATSTSTCWTIVHQDDVSDQATDVQSLRNALEKGNEDVKLQTMQKILIIMLNGNPLPGLLMHVIRFVRVI